MTVRGLVERNKVLIGLNVVLAVCFIAYHIFLDQFYCLGADDFAGIDYASKGIPGLSFAWHFYFAWEGPFLNHVVHGLLMWLVSIGVPPVLVLGLVKVSLFGSCIALMSAVSTRFNLNWSRQQAIFSALVFTLILYVISPEQTQVWHWLTGMVYLYPLIFLQLGGAALLKNKFLWAITAFAFVMQSRVTYSILIFGLIVLLSIFIWWRRDQNRKKWLLLSTFLLLFLAIYLIAPGNYVRLEEHGKAFPFLITQFKIGLQDLFVSYNIAKMDRVLLGLIAVLPLVGTSMSIPRPRQVWNWTIPVVLYVGFAVAHEALFVDITGYCEWSRVLSLHSFLFLTMTSVYGFWFFGLINQQWRARMWPLSIIGVLGLSFYLFKGFGMELQTGQKLKAEYDNRMEIILTHQQTGDTLYVQPINYTGILYFEDFSQDPDHWINYDFTQAYELDFKVALEPENNE